MFCVTCGAKNLDDVDVCAQCGASIGYRCEACGTSNPSHAQYCHNCGEAQTSQAAGRVGREKETARSKWSERPDEDQAERRQLTVLFCDLVGSTSLSERTDPEELARVLRAYHRMCSEVVSRYGGHVAQYLGDGVLVYFGHPVAHEDDAKLAVRTALAIQAGVNTLSHSLQQEGGPELSVRMGIHTGEVIVGHDQLAVGETPNIAARAQSLADSGTIVMTSATFRLVEPFFTCADLGVHHLKGLERQIRMYSVVGETGTQTRMQAAATAGMMPLEGRDQETTFLLKCWQRARAGTGEAVLVKGEPGIGKSRLLEVLKDQLEGESYALRECYCLAYDQHTAFAPISHLLKRVLGFESTDRPQQMLAKLTAAMESLGSAPDQAVPLLAQLVSLPPEVGYPPVNVSPIRARQLILESLSKCLLGTAKTSPVLLIVEDLQWMDPSSLEFISIVLSQKKSLPMLVLLTCRPEFQARWPDDEIMHVRLLSRLTSDQTASLATHVAHNRTLPAEVLREVVNRTDGVPLFVEELTKTILESGILRRTNGSLVLEGPLPSAAIPTTVQDSLMARLDRLGHAKGLAQLGATIGRDFRHDVLVAVAEMREVEVERDLNRLLESDLVSRAGVPPKATYSFRHVLVQDTAYQSLLKRTRALYHERIAGVLFERFPEVAENQPELLAQHYSLAGAAKQAVAYWEKAGIQAMERSANEEATGHFTAALDLLLRLPDEATRSSLEVGLRVKLGLSITASRGYAVPEVEHAYRRARELCDILGNTAELYSVLRGLCTFYIVRDDLISAKELAEECLRLGQETQRADYLIEGYNALGYTVTYMGDLENGTMLLEETVQEYRIRDGTQLSYPTSQDPAVASLCLLALNRWMLGDPLGADRCNEEAIKLAEELKRPFDLAYAHCFAAMYHNLRREFSSAALHAGITIEISQRHGFIAWLSWGTMQLAIAKGRLGDVEEAILQLTSTLAAWQASGAEIATSYFLGGLAEVYREAGRVEDALENVEKAINHAERHGEHWYGSAIYRIRGELLALSGNRSINAAESDFSRAVEIARGQGAKLLELQGALRLHALCLEKGYPEPSRTALRLIFESFPPSVRDIPDLQEASLMLSRRPGTT